MNSLINIMAKLTKWLNQYRNIEEEVDLLTSTGHYSLLYSSFMSLFESLGSSVGKENLKLVSSKIIDFIWDQKFEFSDVPKSPPLEFSLSDPSLKQVERRSSVFASNQSIKKFDYSLISDFSYVKGPGTFNKGTRSEKSVISPGPADYNVKVESVKARSPQAIMTGVKRNNKNLNNGIPGPGAYSPLFAFKAR